MPLHRNSMPHKISIAIALQTKQQSIIKNYY